MDNICNNAAKGNTFIECITAKDKCKSESSHGNKKESESGKKQVKVVKQTKSSKQQITSLSAGAASPSDVHSLPSRLPSLSFNKSYQVNI